MTFARDKAELLARLGMTTTTKPYQCPRPGCPREGRDVAVVVTPKSGRPKGEHPICLECRADLVYRKAA